jgi:hypothetical protein
MSRPKEAEDVGLILAYLGLEPGSPDARRIFGNGPAHVGVVASIVRILAEARAAATGTASRGGLADDWLNHAEVRTSAGMKSPLDVLADEVLAQEALDDLNR